MNVSGCPFSKQRNAVVHFCFIHVSDRRHFVTVLLLPFFLYPTPKHMHGPTQLLAFSQRIMSCLDQEWAMREHRVVCNPHCNEMFFFTKSVFQQVCGLSIIVCGKLICLIREENKNWRVALPTWHTWIGFFFYYPLWKWCKKVAEVLTKI